MLDDLPDGGRLAVAKMRAGGVNPTAIEVFANYYGQLAAGATGMIPEATIEPLTDVPRADDLVETPADVAALSRTALIRLNGGLGTSMGLDKAKSLLPVRDGASFLDVIVRQVRHVRARYGVRLPLLFLHSFNTRADCLAALNGYPDLPVEGVPLDMMQSREPKLRQADLAPVEWPADPELEWCPPGHGDLYPTMYDDGVVDALLAAGFRYACASNADNLGCAPSAALAGWFARSGAPFASEITARTPMDVKGGHLARRKADGRLVLRESAQTLPDETHFFMDAARHPFVTTNNLWFDLSALRAMLAETDGVLGLPLIRNGKTVDPADASSPAVWQLECAMGAAVQVFDGATAIEVPRARFAPVKTTNELTLLRSDVYDFGADAVPRATVDPLPVVTLSADYKLIHRFEALMPYPLGLRECRTLTVRGPWRFGADVRVIGDVDLGPRGGDVPDGTVLRG
jgi:UTP--glucose-1-phosphate uridylyltransferase